MYKTITSVNLVNFFMFQVIKINTLIGVIYVSSLMIQTCNLFQIHIVFANFINSIGFFLPWLMP